jgi:hypothetical protein
VNNYGLDISASNLALDSNSDPDVQIISEQMMRDNNEPTPKKIRVAEDESAIIKYVGNCTEINCIEEDIDTENVEVVEYMDVNSNNNLPNFEEKAASETLLLLSSSSLSKNAAAVTEDNLEINQNIPLAEPEVTSSDFLFNLPVLCPCEAARRLPSIASDENDEDEATFADLNVKLTEVLTQLLGERRLSQLGYPAITGKEVLEKVLRLTGTTITREDDLCTDTCKVWRFSNQYF